MPRILVPSARQFNEETGLCRASGRRLSERLAQAVMQHAAVAEVF
jgi:hypothetical protein